jgi:hypothetical protein
MIGVWGCTITAHLQNSCHIYCRVISCHFSHCEGVELFGLHLASFLHLSKGHGYWRGTCSGPLTSVGAWTTFPAYSDDSPLRVVHLITRLRALAFGDGSGFYTFRFSCGGFHAVCPRFYPVPVWTGTDGISWAGTDRALFVH